LQELREAAHLVMGPSPKARARHVGEVAELLKESIRELVAFLVQGLDLEICKLWMSEVFVLGVQGTWLRVYAFGQDVRPLHNLALRTI
jgi:hypothetical protein